MVNYHVLNDSVVVSFEGKNITIANGDSRYDKVLNAIRNNALDTIPGLVDIEKQLFGLGLEVRDGVLYEGETALPNELGSRIIKFKDSGLPFEPLFKFWNNLKANPSFNARKMLFKFLEHNGHPLTQEGEFIAYRGVSEDFTDKRTGKFDNKPGSVCEMPRESVDDNPNNTCSNGLHVACFDYAKDFGTRLVEVKVNPKDVVTVPVDYDGTKMRVCRFEVVQECEQIRNEDLYNTPVENDEPEQYDDNDSDEAKAIALREEGTCPGCMSEDQWGQYCADCGDFLE